MSQARPLAAITGRQRSRRVNYDEIAELYDSQPYRARAVDPELLAFAAARQGPGLAVLDIGCGTGNQLIANRGAMPGARYVGLDRSAGMLREARRKAPALAWVRGDGAAPPFAAGSFDFVYSQFAFHHVEDKDGMLRAVSALLRPSGRFVLHNLCPQESADWLCYRYFPQSALVDLDDFWAPVTITGVMATAGFTAVTVTYKHVRFEQDLRAWRDIVRRRDTCSQLQAIADAAYQAGVERLERDIADPSIPHSHMDHLCLITVRGTKPEPR